MKKLILMLTTAILTLFLSINVIAYTSQLDPSTPLDTYTSMGEFNTDGDYDGWDFAEWGNRSVSGGSLNGTHIGGYPHMARGQSFEFKVGTIIETRMKYDSGSGHGYMRFLPRISGSENIYPGFFGDSLPIQTDGNFHIYRFTLDAGDTIYFGQLSSARFNPDDGGSSGDNWHIDYIRLSNSSTNQPPIDPPQPTPPYTDNVYNRGLLHCNNAVTNLWPDGDGATNCYITPDDNSSGRQAVSPIMNASNNWGIAKDDSTMPTFETNSPYGGNFLAFDGNDSIIVNNAWPGGDNMDLDLNFRFNGLPPLAGDNYAGLLWTYPVKAYLRNVDDTQGKIMMLVYDAAGNPNFFYSSKLLNQDVWYRLSFSASNNNLKVVVGNDSEGYETDTRSETGLLAPAVTDVIIGSDYFASTRFFQGDLDEIKWGIIIPEPTTLFAGILLGVAFLRRR